MKPSAPVTSALVPFIFMSVLVRVGQGMTGLAGALEPFLEHEEIPKLSRNGTIRDGVRDNGAQGAAPDPTAGFEQRACRERFQLLARAVKQRRFDRNRKSLLLAACDVWMHAPLHDFPKNCLQAAAME